MNGVQRGGYYSSSYGYASRTRCGRRQSVTVGNDNPAVGFL